MARNAGAVVAGLLVSFAIVFVAEMIGHRVYPLPAGTDLTNPDALSAVVGQMPAGAFAFVLGGWLLLFSWVRARRAAKEGATRAI